MKFNHIYYGIFTASALFGVVGGVQAWNLPEGLAKTISLTVGVGGTTSALVCAGLGVAYGSKHQNLENETEEKISQIETAKNRELTDLKLTIDNLKSSISVLETQGNKYQEQIANLKDKLNEKAKEYFQIVAEKDLRIKELEGTVSQRDTRVEDFLSDCRTYTVNFFSARYEDISNLQNSLEKGCISLDVSDELKRSMQGRIQDIQELKLELYDAIEEVRKTDFKDFKEVLGFIFTFDNKFLNVKTRWKDVKAREIKAENKELKQTLSESVPFARAMELHEQGLDDVDEKLTAKYEAMLINNNSIHAQLLDLLEKRNLVINELQQENEQLKEQLDKPYPFYGTSSIPTTGNKISEYYYRYFRFKLDCLDWQETETGCKYIYSLIRNPGITMKELTQENNEERIATLVGAIDKSLPKIELHSHNATVTIEIQTKLPVKQPLPTAEDVFRECGIIRAELFGQTIKKYHIEKTGKPTLRVMSATGGGKGIAVKNLLNYYLHNLDGYEIWLSDPQHGSEEDYWDCEKAATNPNQASNLFNKFAQLLRSRDAKTSTDPKTPILAIFDEFDKKHDLDDKKTASEIWTTIRHHSMRLVLIGQSGEVGKNRWTWDEMSNCCLLFISNAIDTFIKHADKDLGMNPETLEKFSKSYNKASKWIAKANEDISPENQYRLAALYCNGQALLLEIPPAHKGMLSDGKSWLASKPFEKVTQMSTNTQKIVISNILNEVQNEVENEVLKPEIKCKHCGSTAFHKHQAVKDPNKYRYLCLNPECGKTFVDRV